MDDPAVAEWVVTQVTVRVGPVESRCRRELAGRIAATACIVGWTRSIGAWTVGYIAVRLAVRFRTIVVRLVIRLVIRMNVWTIVIRLVVRAVVGYVAIVWTVVLSSGFDTALGADVAHVVVIVPAGINARIVSPAYCRVTVRRRSVLVGYRSAVLRSGSFPVLRIYGSAVLNRIIVVGPWL